MGGLPQPAAAAAIAEAAAPTINFVMVWMGAKYGPEYPLILGDSIVRNATGLERIALWCVTDRPDELPEGVAPITPEPGLPGWWQKVALFSPRMPWEPGERVIYFDLDVAITGRLEDLAERKGIIKDWNWPTYNSSVMAWDHGEHRAVWSRFTPAIMERRSEALAGLLPAGQVNGGDQEWISEVSAWPTFPREWFISYRKSAVAWPPDGSIATIFHGEPKPHEVTAGWVPEVWKVGGLTSFPQIKGVNTSEEDRLHNVETNSRRDLPWFSGFRDEGRSCVIACGAPSMRTKIAAIAKKKRQGARVVSVNNAWRLLHENGVTPDVNVILDARPENAAFLDGAPKSMRLLLASQCHPSLFDKAAEMGLDVVLWHNGYDAGFDKLWEMLESYRETKPIVLVPGGSTVGLRSIWLAAFSGFRTIHLYGIDSSFADDGAHHAYAQALNDQDQGFEVQMGERRYVCARWMVRQAEEFRETWRDMRAFSPMPGVVEPVALHVHGRGLIPDIARKLGEGA